VPDRKSEDTTSRKAGRGLIRALRGLFGPGRLRRAANSARVLKEEFKKGRRKRAADEPSPIRRIEHRDVDD
jgi:hypothetical protein